MRTDIMETKRKTYSELSKLTTYDERFEYCKCISEIGIPTFGGSRYLNQAIYTNDPMWKDVRDHVIARDNGCDLGIIGYEIPSGGYGTVHHLNPITREQVLNRDPCIYDMDNLILVRSDTHRLLHYGSYKPERDPIVRKPNDMCPWRNSQC